MALNIAKKILINFIFVLIYLILMGFKKQEYKVVSEEVEGKTFYFTIPNSFCRFENNLSNVIEFVKCYELELKKERELQFFSEKIIISFEENDKRIQDITDNYFVKLQLENYKKMSNEDKENILYNKYYPFKNKTNFSISKNNYFFNRVGVDEEENKYINYQSSLFLNKRYFFINWVQYLTKNEKPLELTDKKFLNLIKENKKNNNYKHSLYKYPWRQIIITKPKFGNFANYTDTKVYNDGSFLGVFKNLLNKKDEKKSLIFRITIIHENTDTKKVFKLLTKENEEKEDDKKLDIKLITYKTDNFIKITKNDFIMYLAYIDFSFNMTGVISLQIPNINNKNNDDVKYLYKYKHQLIKDNL